MDVINFKNTDYPYLMIVICLKFIKKCKLVLILISMTNILLHFLCLLKVGTGQVMHSIWLITACYSMSLVLLYSQQYRKIDSRHLYLF